MTICNQTLATPITEICLTKECIIASSNLIEAMDTTVNPCDNFFNFVCGNYVKNSNLLNEMDEESHLKNINKEITEQLRTIASEPINEDEIKPFQVVKQYYSQCMNETDENVQEIVVNHLMKTLDNFGGLPFLKGDKWNETDFDWESVVLELEKSYQENNLFNLEIINSNHLYIVLKRPTEFQEISNEVYMNYWKLLFGSDRHVHSFIKKIKLIEKILKNNSHKYKDENNLTQMTLSDFQKEVPYLNWKNHINKLLPDTVQVTEDQIVYVSNLNYFRELGEIIRSVSKEAKANFLLFSFVKLAGNHLKIHNEMYPRWKYCLLFVKMSLNFPISAMYMQKHFDMKIRGSIKEMIEAIHNEMINTFREAKWIEKTAQDQFLDRLENIQSDYIGFLDELMDLVKMEKYFENLNLESDFYSSKLLLTKWSIQRELDKDSNPYSDFFLRFGLKSFTEVNAYYSSDKNAISMSTIFFNFKIYL